jgi:hypothetical protein
VIAGQRSPSPSSISLVVSLSLISAWATIILASAKTLPHSASFFFLSSCVFFSYLPRLILQTFQIRSRHRRGRTSCLKLSRNDIARSRPRPSGLLCLRALGLYLARGLDLTLAGVVTWTGLAWLWLWVYSLSFLIALGSSSARRQRRVSRYVIFPLVTLF